MDRERSRQQRAINKVDVNDMGSKPMGRPIQIIERLRKPLKRMRKKNRKG